MSRPDFYTVLNYGEKRKCALCGMHFLTLDKSEQNIFCRRCANKSQDANTQGKQNNQAKEKKERVVLSDEEKLKRKRESQKKYRDNHRQQINQYVRERKKADPVFKLECQARNTVYQSFARTGNVKPNRCEDVTGLSIDGLCTYLVGTYKDNYGVEWDGNEPVHIDHIVPLATAKTEEDVIRLCHYTNLQLLTAKDNLKKGSTYANC